MRGTHSLEVTLEGTCQDIERNQLSVGHSLPGDRRVKGKSGHRIMRESSERAMIKISMWSMD